MGEDKADWSWCERLADDDAPRNAAAIRTAIMLGASFTEHRRESLNGKTITTFSIEGLNHSASERCTIAWLFLATRGMGIDPNGVPRLAKDLLPETGPAETYRRTALLFGEKLAPKKNTP